MFKSWRSDKNKIKAVFKLQFQATQVPKLKKPALIISLVPDDVGKPTFKLEKAAIQDGTCSWENPIYVSVKLIRDPKTGKIHEKIYHFVVATGSSKSGFLGEASVDFADFVAETQPLIVSLPLKFANSGAVLHITIEKIQGDERSNEENGFTTLSKEESFDSLPDDDETGYDQNIAEDRLRGSMGSVASDKDNGSDQTTHPPNRQNSIPPRRVDILTTKKNGHKRSNTDWSMSSASDGSYVESRNSPENNFQTRWAEDSNDSVDKLKAEMVNLMRQAEMSDLEMQSLRKQVAKESKRAQELSGELKCLKEERDELFMECEQLKLQKRLDDDYAEKRLQSVSEDSSSMIEEITEELNHEKELSKNLRLQLQRTEESNSNLILAVRDLNEMLDQKNKEIASLSIRREEVNSQANINEDEYIHEIADLKHTIEDMHQKLESRTKQNEELEKQVERLSQGNKILKEENFNISSKLDQNEQMLLQNGGSEHTIKELEFQVHTLEDRIKQQSEEYSESLITINELETLVRSLKKELEEQARAFEENLDSVARAKTEQEQRAIQAEDDLRKIRSKNTVIAERLQEKCKRLSMEMASKLEESEKQIKGVTAEANELRIEKKNLEEMLQQANEKLRQINDQHELKLEELSNQIESKKKLNEELRQEVDAKTHQLQCGKEEEDERLKTLTTEIELLKNELKGVKRKDNDSSRHSKETDLSTQRWMKEKEDLEKKLASTRDEMEKVQAQLSAARSTKNEKETTIKNLKKEVENLSLKFKELQNSLTTEQKEKETLRKQVAKLKVDLQRKEDNIPKRPTTRTGDSWKKERKVSASYSSEEANLAQLREELTFFKDRNSSMEKELKEMEERYSEISLKFAEVEGERQQLVMVVRNLKNGKKPQQ